MYELDFDIEEVLSELKGKSVKEKIAVLEEISDDLQSAISNIQDIQQEIETEYFDKVKQEVFDMVRQFVVISRIKGIQFSDDALYLFNGNNKFAVFPTYAGGSWFVHIQLMDIIFKNETRYQAYRKMAECTETTYKDGVDSIVIKLAEEDVALKMVEIINSTYGGI